jgi:hypothetical protein
MAPEPRPRSAATARAEAIERAIAKGRSLPDRDRPAPPPRSGVDPNEIPLGFLVISIVLVEFILGVVLVAVGGGLIVLALGLWLDAVARVLGTIAVERSGQEWGSGWRWICGLGGSPGVALFAFQRDRTLLGTDPVPMAGPIAVLALVVLLIGLAGLPAGI